MTRSLCFWLGLALLGLAFAQTTLRAEPETPEEPSVEPEVDVLFSVYVWPTEGILTQDSAVASLPRTFFDGIYGRERIHLNRGGTSAQHRYRGPLPLEMYDLERELVPAPEEDGPDAPPVVVERRIPVLRANFPPNARRLVLIAFPQEREADGAMLTFPMPVLDQALSNGDVSLYNADRRPLSFSIGDNGRNVLIRPFETVRIRGAMFDGPNPRVRVHRRDDSGAARLVASTRMYVDPERANFFFLYPRGERNMRLLRVGAHELPAGN